MAWISVDFPTPEFPETRVVRPASSSHLLHAPALPDRHLQHPVAGPLVDRAELRDGLRVLQVELRQEDRHRDLVGLAGHQKPVHELRGRLGRTQRRHQQRLVDVGGDDMRLFRKVRSPADHVVAPRQDVGDHIVAPLVGLARHFVAHHHGIGRTHPFQAQSAPDAAAHRLTVV